jgi:thymidylate synthase (FAD)
MKIVKQSWEWNRIPDGMQILRDIEKAGRTCYKSEDKITEDSAKEFVSKMIKSGHHAMIEFGIVPPVKIITDRGVTHEIVRHRLFSFAQESTRYCNYSKNKFGNEITIIQPVWITDEEMNIYNKIISEKVGNVISLDDIPASLVGSFF